MNAFRTVTALFVLVSSMAQTRPPDALLVQARRLYNEGRYGEAIKAAQEARLVPATAVAAAVLFARAHLEQHRVTPEDTHLTAARDALKTVDATTLGARDQVEFNIALGELLYLDDQLAFEDRYSAAAEQFEVALGRADLLDPVSRDLLFDWWALSLDRQAQLGPEAERRPAYQRIVTRAEDELARQPTATSAAYWLAAAARGIDDLPRAWGAAVAGWVRAASLGARGAALREDLDRLVSQVILPERAKQLAAGGDAKPALAYLQAQWEQTKQRWK
jgi:hypothetical protein